MMHERGPLALRQLDLLITRAPPGLRFVLATRHDVRRRADVQAEQDRRVAGFDWQKQPTADPHTPIPKCVADPWPTASPHAALLRAGWLLQITASRPRAATHAGTEL